ncbi:MAG: DNA internalization-related competence protein ComEC/Rec2 [Candidatus Hydrogenedentota bacterium]
MNRPVVWVAAGIAAGTFLAAHGVLGSFLSSGFLFAFAIAVIAGFKRYRIAAVVAVILLFCGVAAMNWNFRRASFEWDALSRYLLRLSPAYMTVTGRVATSDIVLPDDEYTSFVLDVTEVHAEGHSKAIPGRMLVRWTGASNPVYPGETISIRGEPDIRLGSVNFDISGVEEYYRRNGVHSLLSVSGSGSYEHRSDAPWWWVPYWAGLLRQKQAETFSAVTPPKGLPFVLAVWLGDRGTLRQDELESYVRTGTAHILSVSGVHVSIVYVSLEFLLALFVRKRWIRTIVILAAIVLFTLMAGARVSSVRAMLMIACYLAADLVNRERDAPTALSLSLIVIVLRNPLLLFDVGFLLSFSSVASILLFQDPVQRAIADTRLTFFGAGLTAITVQLLPLPLAIRYFHILPVTGVVANLLIIPLLTLILWLCLMTSLCALVSMRFAMLFGHALLPLVESVRWIAGSFASLGPSILLPTPTAWAIGFCWVATLALAYLIWRREHWRRGMSLALVALVSAIVLWRPLTVQPQVVFLDVGHGDAALIVDPSGDTTLVDGGNRIENIDLGKEVVAPTLWAMGYSRVDRIVVSHSDLDHLGGLFYILDHFDVGEVILGFHPSGRTMETDFVSMCTNKGIPVRRVMRGDRLYFGTSSAHIIHPPESWPSGAGVNNASVVMNVNWQGQQILFTGDIETFAEDSLKELDCTANILKSPHHGSDTSNSQQFLESVRPDWAVISTGPQRTNRGLDRSIIERFHANSIDTLRTDRHGAVRVTVTNGELYIDHARKLPSLE